jgi:cytochrome oxidase Cu insertion factor (SCO1/SenC/PrrC family)
LWLIGVAAVVAVVLVAVGVVVLSQSGPAASGPTAGSGSVTVGTAVGQLAPDFQLVDVDGRAVSRDSLRGMPALILFTTSYCAPCQEGALSMQRILTRIGATDELAAVIVFVDPGEPTDALTSWKSQFGRPGWITAFAVGSVIQDYGVQALDTKYLLDRDGVIRVADLVPVQFREDAWERDLRAVLQR